MKSGTISIILGALGILFVIWFNYQTFELYQTEFLKIQNKIGVMNSKIFLLSLSKKDLNIGLLV